MKYLDCNIADMGNDVSIDLSGMKISGVAELHIGSVCLLVNEEQINGLANVLNFEKKEEEFVPHLEFMDCDGNWKPCGNIGEETEQEASFGEKLCVGDVVGVDNVTLNKALGVRFVAKESEFPKGYIMGLACLNFKNGCVLSYDSGMWQIRKVRSYKDLKHGEIINDIRVVLKNER